MRLVYNSLWRNTGDRFSHDEDCLVKEINMPENDVILSVCHQGWIHFTQEAFLSVHNTHARIQKVLSAGIQLWHLFLVNEGREGRLANQTPFKWRFAGVPMMSQHWIWLGTGSFVIFLWLRTSIASTPYIFVFLLFISFFFGGGGEGISGVGDPRGGFFYPTRTLMVNSYNLYCLAPVLCTVYGTSFIKDHIEVIS